jgi:anti-sigma factor RsiW
MRQQKTPLHNDVVHQEIWELLPWYVNGTLDTQEFQRVEAHLALCALCQEERARCCALATAVRTADDVAWEPSPAHLARLLARLEAAEASASATGGRWQRWHERWRKGRGILHSTPPAMRWAFAVQCALVLLLAGGLLWQSTGRPALYTTLSDATHAPASTNQQIRLVFTEDITERELRSLLTSVHGTITSGPSAAGAYTIDLPPTTAVPSALEVLRAHRRVRLAEPVVTR